MTLRTSLSATGRTGAKSGLVGVHSALDPMAVTSRLLKAQRYGAAARSRPMNCTGQNQDDHPL